MEGFVSKEMVEFLLQNFQVINEFDRRINAFSLPEVSRRSMEIIFNHFKDLTNKVYYFCLFFMLLFDWTLPKCFFF